MSFIPNASDGNSEASRDAPPKPHHNLSIVYIDHELDKPITASIEDEAGENSGLPNLTVVYLDHHLDGSGSTDTSHGDAGTNACASQTAVLQGRRGLFCLPPEVRIMVWEYLLPGKRLLGAQAWLGLERNSPRPSRCNNDAMRGGKSRWYFGVYEYTFQQGVERGESDWLVKVPVLLHVCAESRSVGLRYGKFVFGDSAGDEIQAGTWWNPDLDVLVFEVSWSVQQHPRALRGVQGLEHVKHVALDENLALDLDFSYGYEGPPPYDDTIQDSVAISLRFRESWLKRNFILEFFPNFQQLTIVFASIYAKIEARGPAPVENECSVTFRLGTDFQMALKAVQRFCGFWSEAEMSEAHCNAFFRPSRDHDDTILTRGPIYAAKDQSDANSSLIWWD